MFGKKYSTEPKPTGLRKAWRHARLASLILSVPFMTAAAAYVLPAKVTALTGIKEESVYKYKIQVSEFLLGTQQNNEAPKQ